MDTNLDATPPAHTGCTICGAGQEDLAAVPDDRCCRVCGSLSEDRILHGVLGELRDAIELTDVRMLLFSVSDCLASRVFDVAEQYRCASEESVRADLIAEPAELSSLPDNCFHLVVVNGSFAHCQDPDAGLAEIRRVLMPGGSLLAPAAEPVNVEIAGQRSEPSEIQRYLVHCLKRHYEMRSFPGVDPVTRVRREIHLARKLASPLQVQPLPTAEITGYAYHLSRKTGSRIVFCLDGQLGADDRLPVETISGEVVGHVTVGSYVGGHATGCEPWAEGFHLPPRASYELEPSLPSGVYKVGGKIPFIHRSRKPASVAVLIPSHTATAFNDAGGRSLYAKPDAPSADILSFHRPIATSLLLERTLPFAKWFTDANPFPQDTTYLIDSDLEEPDALDDVEVLVVIGRSEYWTRSAREHFDAYVDRGGRALLLCSEIMHWQVRLDRARHRLHRYKNADPHPDPLMRTTLWHDPTLRYPIYPRTGCELWYGGFSASDEEVGWGGMRIVCRDSPLLTGSGFTAGDVVSLPDASVWDGAPVEHGPDGLPRIDFGDSPPWRHEVIGYNLVKPIVDELPPGQAATSLWVVLRRTPRSGTIIHAGTMGWCGPRAIDSPGANSDGIKKAILCMLNTLYNDDWPFSYAPDEG